MLASCPVCTGEVRATGAMGSLCARSSAAAAPHVNNTAAVHQDPMAHIACKAAASRFVMTRNSRGVPCCLSVSGDSRGR